MKTSDDGIFALALHEGIVPAPYKDSVGVWTYGIGHTLGAGHPDPAKMARGMPSNLDAALQDVFDLFRRDVVKYEDAVNRAVKVKVTQAQFDALVSFHYNTGAIGKASLVKRLNAGDFAGAAAGFMAWKKPPEIIERRKAEQALFATGVYPKGQATVWGVTSGGSVVWKPVRRLSRTEVLAMLDRPVAAPHSLTQAERDMADLERLGYKDVRAFQRNVGLAPDGVIGPMTRAKMHECLSHKMTRPAANSDATPVSPHVNEKPKNEQEQPDVLKPATKGRAHAMLGKLILALAAGMVALAAGAREWLGDVIDRLANLFG